MSELSPPRVAVVEDDPETVAFLQHLFTEMGLHLIACPPSIAPACIVADRPDLIILEVRLGTLDGIDLFQQLRAHAGTCTLPVIFFTANAAKVRSRLPRYQEQGAALVSKPNITQLIAALQETLPQPAAG